MPRPVLALAAGEQPALGGWLYGDFDYSGDITSDDYFLWLVAFDAARAGALPLSAEKPVAVAGEAIEELRLLAASQPLPGGEAELYAGQDETSPGLEPAMAALLVGLGELPLAAGLESGLTTSEDARSSASLDSGASWRTATESAGVADSTLVPDGELVELLALSVVALPLGA